MSAAAPVMSPAPPPVTPVLAVSDSAHEDATISGRAQGEHVAGQKRKAGPRELTRTPSNRFKIVSQLVIAMQRFQGALNPTYTFGKRAASSDGSVEGRAKRTTADSEATSGLPLPAPASESDYLASPELELRSAFPRRGHRSQYLVAPLPPLPNERRVSSN